MTTVSTPHPPSDSAGTRIVIAAYEWSPGDCYRCARHDENTAALGRLPHGGEKVEVRACVGCVIALERERQAAAERYGWPYEPGEQSL